MGWRKESAMEVKEISVWLNKDNMPYLKEEGSGFYVNEQEMHDSPSKIYDFACSIGMPYSAVEKVYMLLFDTANHILSETMISQGTVNRSLFSAREICQVALLGGAVSVALIHNHPGQTKEPSDEDIMVTMRVQKALEAVGIRLIDHIIATKYGYYSFHENNMLKEVAA